jgi:hypothetical protein
MLSLSFHLLSMRIHHSPGTDLCLVPTVWIKEADMAQEQRAALTPPPDPEAQRLAAVDRATLTPLVRQALDREQAEVTAWAYKPIYGGAGTGGSIYRFSGVARGGHEEIPWSLILKAIRAIPERQSPSSPGYWRREAEAYQSGLLYDLPGGITAPRCYDVVEWGGDACWLWLEEVEDRFGAWPIEQYGAVARHLGQLNGAYLAGRPLPEASWLSQKWMRSYVEPAAPMFERLRSSLDHPLIRRLLPGDAADGLLACWESRERYLSALERLPRTFCHLDAFRRNLFARQGPDGREETVAVDWSYTGIASIGEELVPLVGATLSFFEVGPDRAQELDQIVFDGYVQGLRDAGWDGDPRLARLGYLAGLQIRYTLGGLGEALVVVFDERRHAGVEQALGHPMEEVMDMWAAVAAQYAILCQEVDELLDTVA